MDRLSTFATTLKNYCYNEESDKLEAIEIRPSHNSFELQRRQIPDVIAGLWSANKSLDETEAPALLRLVCVETNRDTYPYQIDIRESSLDTVLKNFKIEEAYEYSFIRPAGITLVQVCQTEHSNTLTFSLSMPSRFGAAWEYDCRSGLTKGVCWAESWFYGRMHKIMSQQKGWTRHPLFLALVASIVIGILLDIFLDSERNSVSRVESRTKYHGFHTDSSNAAKGDYASLSQTMSGSATMLAAAERVHRILNEFLGDISLYSQRYNANDDPSFGNVKLETEDCVETLRRKLKMQKIELDYISRRVEVQLTAVRNAPFVPQTPDLRPSIDPADPLPTQLFNLISQKDAKLGVAVAEDSRTLASASKEDSTAMKTIAAVTIAFLPGTSVAALFAMPVFDWDAVGDDKIVSKRFWVYWAVAIPLTFLTLLFWVLWTKRQARMHRASEKRAREDLWSDIEGLRGR